MLVGTAPGRPLAAAATVSQPAGETSAEPGPEGMGPGGAAPRPLWRRRAGNGPARNGPARPLSRRSAPGSVFGSASACGAGRGAVVAVAAVAAGAGGWRSRVLSAAVRYTMGGGRPLVRPRAASGSLRRVKATTKV